MALQSENVLNISASTEFRKGNNQNFSNVDPTMTEVFFFLNSSKRANGPVPNMKTCFNISASTESKREGSEFSHT